MYLGRKVSFHAWGKRYKTLSSDRDEILTYPIMEKTKSLFVEGSVDLSGFSPFEVGRIPACPIWLPS